MKSYTVNGNAIVVWFETSQHYEGRLVACYRVVRGPHEGRVQYGIAPRKGSRWTKLALVRRALAVARADLT